MMKGTEKIKDKIYRRVDDFRFQVLGFRFLYLQSLPAGRQVRSAIWDLY